MALHSTTCRKNQWLPLNETVSPFIPIPPPSIPREIRYRGRSGDVINLFPIYWKREFINIEYLTLARTFHLTTAPEHQGGGKVAWSELRLSFQILDHWIVFLFFGGLVKFISNKSNTINYWWQFVSIPKKKDKNMSFFRKK